MKWVASRSNVRTVRSGLGCLLSPTGLSPGGTSPSLFVEVPQGTTAWVKSNPVGQVSDPHRLVALTMLLDEVDVVRVIG